MWSRKAIEKVKIECIIFFNALASDSRWLHSHHFPLGLDKDFFFFCRWLGCTKDFHFTLILGCLMFIFSTSFLAFPQTLSFHVLSNLNPLFVLGKKPQKDSVHVYTRCFFFFPTLHSEHIRQLSQWSYGSKALSSSMKATLTTKPKSLLSGDLQPSHVWPTTHLTAFPWLQRVQMFPLLEMSPNIFCFMFHISRFTFLCSSFCRKNPVNSWCFTSKTFSSVLSFSHYKKLPFDCRSERIHVLGFLCPLPFTAQPLHLFRPWRAEQRGHWRVSSIKLHLKKN